MKNLLSVLIVGALAWQGYAHYQAKTHQLAPATPVAVLADAPPAAAPPLPFPASDSDSASRFACDGRTHCSQMHSCAEAEYFLKHCPGTEMDGDGDGIPCERQWCH